MKCSNSECEFNRDATDCIKIGLVKMPICPDCSEYLEDRKMWGNNSWKIVPLILRSKND